jgi:chitinase
MGVAFYGRGYVTSTTDRNGFNQKQVSGARGGGYTFIKDSLLTQHGYKSYWDEKAKAPYLFNDSTKVFITYDDERSVKYKCQYVKEHKMGGVMFWEYSSDPKGYLLEAITKEFKK